MCPSISQRLAILARTTPADAAAGILVRTLRHAGDDEIDALASAAAMTGHPAAVRAIVPLFPRLSGRTQRQLRTLGASPTTTALAALVRNARSADLRAAATRWLVVREGAGVPAALARALGRGEREDAALAEALRVAAVDALGGHGRRTVRAAERRSLDEAVTYAVAAWRAHRQPAVLVAAALLLVNDVAAFSERERPPSWSALRHRLDDPVLGRGAVRWLGHPRLDGVAERLLTLGAGTWSPARLAADVHLLRCPRRRAALARLGFQRGFLPASADPTAWSEGEARLVAALTAGPDAILPSARWADAARRAPSAAVRWRAGAGLGDPAPTLRRAAAVPQLEHDPGVAKALAQDPDVTLARRGRTIAARASVPALRTAWVRLDAPARTAAVRCALEHARASVEGWCGEALAAYDTAVRLEAVQSARRWGLVPSLEPALIECLSTGAPRVAASAAAALADGRGEARIRALLAALDHDDARVVANAVVALERARRRGAGAIPHADRLAELSSSTHNRVRANAVRAQRWVSPVIAREGVRRMLDDQRPLHRVSGLWAARALGDAALRADVGLVARLDGQPEVRDRAARVLRGLDPRTRRSETAEAVG